MRKTLAITLSLLILFPYTSFAALAPAQQNDFALRIHSMMDNVEKTAERVLKRPYATVDFNSQLFINVAQEEKAIYQVILKNKGDRTFLFALESELINPANKYNKNAAAYLREVVKSAQNGGGPVRAFNYVSSQKTFARRMASELLKKGRLDFAKLVSRIESRMLVSHERAVALALTTEVQYAKAAIKSAMAAEVNAARQITIKSLIRSKGSLVVTPELRHHSKILMLEHLNKYKAMRTALTKDVTALNYALSTKELTEIQKFLEANPSLAKSFRGLGGKSYIQRLAVKTTRAIPLAIILIIIVKVTSADDVVSDAARSVKESLQAKAQQQEELTDIINNHPELIILLSAGNEKTAKTVEELLDSSDGLVTRPLEEVVPYLSYSSAFIEELIEDEDLLTQYIESLKTIDTSVNHDLDKESNNYFLDQMKGLQAPADNTRVKTYVPLFIP